MKTRPGEIWLADLGIAGKTRPVLIVSRADPNPPRTLCVYVPLTSQNRGSQYEIQMRAFPFLREESWANVQAIGSIPEARLVRKLGDAGKETLATVHEAIRFALGM